MKYVQEREIVCLRVRSVDVENHRPSLVNSIYPDGLTYELMMV